MDLARKMKFWCHCYNYFCQCIQSETDSSLPKQNILSLTMNPLLGKYFHVHKYSKQKAGYAVCMELCVETDKIVAIISPGC